MAVFYKKDKYEYDRKFIAGFWRLDCIGASLVFLFAVELGILERIFPVYAQSVLD